MDAFLFLCILVYLKKNKFLPLLNNELSNKNAEYKKNLASLDLFVMIRFSEDVMIKPGHTAVG
jgi:palmitoyl-protein thioesterase